MFRIGKCKTKLEGRTKMGLVSILEAGQILDMCGYIIWMDHL